MTLFNVIGYALGTSMFLFITGLWCLVWWLMLTV